MPDQVETQNEVPENGSEISVGISDLRTKVEVNKDGETYVFIPTFEIMLSLPANKKGAHMSRIVESINEQLQCETQNKSDSLESLCRNVLLTLKERHGYDSAEIHMDTELSIDIFSPHSKLQTTEVHDIKLSIFHDSDGKFMRQYSVLVVGGSACPHAMNNNDFGRTHIQRSKIEINAMFEYDYPEVTFEQLIKIANKSFSAEVFTLVKSPDEQEIIKNMYENPKFVEDICRSVENKLRNTFHDGIFKIIVKNEESIHRHDVLAKKGFEI